MPIYEYRCDQCGNVFELRQGYDAASKQPCPKCSTTAERVIHAAPVFYRGAGFSATDNRKFEPTPESEMRRPRMAREKSMERMEKRLRGEPVNYDD